MCQWKLHQSFVYWISSQNSTIYLSFLELKMQISLILRKQKNRVVVTNCSCCDLVQVVFCLLSKSSTWEHFVRDEQHHAISSRYYLHFRITSLQKHDSLFRSCHSLSCALRCSVTWDQHYEMLSFCRQRVHCVNCFSLRRCRRVCWAESGCLCWATYFSLIRRLENETVTHLPLV